MPATYYIWKWAENDVPGRPAEVVSQLNEGCLPAALQMFQPQRVLDQLVKVATQRRPGSSEWRVELEGASGDQVRCIRLTDPADNSPWLADRLLWAVWEADLTVFNASLNRLIGLPKRNVVELPEGCQLVDIERADIPRLLHRLADRPGLAAIACYDRDGNMFQVWAHHRRFAVEWQVLPERDFNRHRIWGAGRPTPTQRRARLGSLEGGLELFSRELLEMAEVYGLWTSFLAGENRPASHVWRDVTRDLNNPGQPPRHRHREPEAAFPDDRFFGQN